MTSIKVEALPENIKTEAFHRVNPLGGEKEGNLKVDGLSNTSCMNSCRDNLHCVDEVPQPSKVDGSDDVLGHGDYLAANGLDAESTEYSSSVEGDFSDYEDGFENDSCNMKMESEMVEFPLIFNQCNRVFRKKKLTEHWRKFIQPLMWRCRWIELRIKELQSQVARYDRELLAYGKKESEEPPLPQHSAAEQQQVASMGQKLYHRKKRRKIEEVVDVPSYISQHVIFSYFDSKPESGGLSIDEGVDAQEQNNNIQDDVTLNTLNLEWPILEIKGNDKFLEQILFDIEAAQVRVLVLTSQLRKLYENADFYSPGLFIPGDPNYRSSLSPRCSPIHNQQMAPLETASTSLHMRDFENEDLVLSGSAVSSYGDAGHPDIIESTVDLLAIGNSSDHNQIGLGTDVAEDILIHNQVAEESLHRFENVSHTLAKASDTVKAEAGCAAHHMVSSSETETDPEIAPAVGRKPTLKRCAGAAEFRLRRSKRKRKMRRTSPGSWTGEKIRRRKQPRKQGGPR